MKEGEKGNELAKNVFLRREHALEARCTLLYGRRIIHTSAPARPGCCAPGLKERSSRGTICRNWIAFPAPWGIKPLR